MELLLSQFLLRLPSVHAVTIVKIYKNIVKISPILNKFMEPTISPLTSLDKVVEHLQLDETPGER